MRQLPLHALALAIALSVAPRAAFPASPSAPSGVESESHGRITEWEIPSAMAPRDPSIDAEGHIYFAMAKGDRIVRFDPRARQFAEWRLPAGTAPHGTAATSDGKVYFGGRGKGLIGELDPATGITRYYVTPASRNDIYSVAKDAREDIWFTLRKSGAVGRLDRSTGAVSTYAMDGEPYGLIPDSQGRIWVTRIEAGKLSHLDPRTGERRDIDTGVGSRPRRIAIAPDGGVWVTLFGLGRVVRIDPATRTISGSFEVPGGSTSGPYSACVDSSGQVWVSVFRTDTIAVLDPGTGRFREFILPNKLSGVRNVTMDARGRFWYIATSVGRLGVIE